MPTAYLQQRLDILQVRLDMLVPSVERAQQSIDRLEAEQVPAGIFSSTRAAQISAARAMAATLQDRERQMRIAIGALQAELAER